MGLSKLTCMFEAWDIAGKPALRFKFHTWLAGEIKANSVPLWGATALHEQVSLTWARCLLAPNRTTFSHTTTIDYRPPMSKKHQQCSFHII